MRRLKQKILRWWLCHKINLILRHIDSCPDNAEVSRDGRSPEYWEGKLDGLEVSLVLLGLLDPGNADVMEARDTIRAGKF